MSDGGGSPSVDGAAGNTSAPSGFGHGGAGTSTMSGGAGNVVGAAGHEAGGMSAIGSMGGSGASAPKTSASFVPLFDEGSAREPAVVEDVGTALITRFSDRARDRHAREDQFQAYEHYLHIYWEHRTAEVEIVDTVGKGGNSITFNVTTQWKLDDNQAELRFFYRGINTVAEYHDNRTMTPIGDRLYTRTVDYNHAQGRQLRVGDKMEFELSQFLDAPPRGRDNYYGTTFLYVVGRGLVPWEGTGERRDSNPIGEHAWLGGHTTVHRNESNEPDNLFMQMATNLAPQNGQRFVLGRRVAHTNFVDGSHDESDQNPIWQEQAGKAGPYRIHHSCNGCHERNGRAVPLDPGVVLDRYVFRVGTVTGDPEPALGTVFQPNGEAGTGEGAVRIARWEEEDGLRRPIFEFEGAKPERFSARISPQLVGLGLLEAIAESSIAELADPDDKDGNGVSGRMRVVPDHAGILRVGRFGWKAGQPTLRGQVAAALRTDLGVLTSVYPAPDCGIEQTGCGPDGVELEDTNLDDLTLYVALLGVQPQRDYDDARVGRGGALFGDMGCSSCHATTFVTSAHATLAELRSQTIHPYTDLLLHDMGPGLADSLPEGDADGAEWRTPPLWGVGRTAGVSGNEAYLHDGRARNLREAVLWHGGEAERAKHSFESASSADQEALLSFLKSL